MNKLAKKGGKREKELAKSGLKGGKRGEREGK